MRHIIHAVFAAFLLALPAAAQERDIEAVIGKQFEAFRAGEVSRAFAFASPAIRDRFRTPGNFAAMVRQGYPMVWQPGAVRFGPLRDEAGRLWQRVRVTDAQGRVHLLDYRMQRVDGAWRIGAVRILGAPGAGV